MASSDEVPSLPNDLVEPEPYPIDKTVLGERITPFDDSDPHENLRRKLKTPLPYEHDDLFDPDRELDFLRRHKRDDPLVETPLNPHDLCLNPGADEEAPSNPLCPVCEDPIRPVTGQGTRRFECGCAVTWRFTFDAEDDGGASDGE